MMKISTRRAIKRCFARQPLEIATDVIGCAATFGVLYFVFFKVL